MNSTKNLKINPLDITPVIDRNPVIVSPDTLLVDVLTLMSNSSNICILPDTEINTELIPEDLTTSDAQSINHANSMGCVLVMENDQIMGIFTERDLVSLTAAGAALTGIKMREVVSSPVITINESEIRDIFTILSVFRQHRIRHLPIIDERNKLVGIITQNSIRQVLQPINLLTRLRFVRDVMITDVIHAPLDSCVIDLAQMMAEKKISCVVIADKLIAGQNLCLPQGIITERDIVQFIALELNLSKMLAKDVMSSPLFCLRPTDSLWLAHQEMQKRRVRRLVVVGEHGELKGIVSQSSLLQALNPSDMYVLIEGLQKAIDERTKALQITNKKLYKEITQRKKAQDELKKSHDALQILVEQRTAELSKANELLKQDIQTRETISNALLESEKKAREKAEQLNKTLKELQTTQSQLIHTEKMSALGLLLAGIAHEINNPVNFINGNLQYAASYVQDLIDLIEVYQKNYSNPVEEVQDKIEEIELDFLKEDVLKLLQSMTVGVDRIRDLVLSLKIFSRTDSTNMKYVNIHEGLDSTLLILQHQLKASSDRHEIKVIKEYGNLPLVECMGGQLNQVFMNLISNSIDALEGYGNNGVKIPNPQIKIKTELLGENQVCIRIGDNGPGMTEEVRQKLFETFFTTKPVGKGTGLGLSISYQIVVEKHNGLMNCISTPGSGAEFIIVIPVKQKSNQ